MRDNESIEELLDFDRKLGVNRANVLVLYIFELQLLELS